MIKWYLVMTLFVAQGDRIDARHLYSVQMDNHAECVLEAKARVDLFTQYLGTKHIRNYVTDPCLATGRCIQQKKFSYSNDPDYGTYEVQLYGTLIGFEVGCRPREVHNPKTWRLFPE